MPSARGVPWRSACTCSGRAPAMTRECLRRGRCSMTAPDHLGDVQSDGQDIKKKDNYDSAGYL
jgi:hypothetical protein